MKSRIATKEENEALGDIAIGLISNCTAILGVKYGLDPLSALTLVYQRSAGILVSGGSDAALRYMDATRRMLSAKTKAESESAIQDLLESYKVLEATIDLQDHKGTVQ